LFRRQSLAAPLRIQRSRRSEQSRRRAAIERFVVVMNDTGHRHAIRDNVRLENRRRRSLATVAPRSSRPELGCAGNHVRPRATERIEEVIALFSIRDCSLGSWNTARPVSVEPDEPCSVSRDALDRVLEPEA
jgi:hypothetical protein